MDLQSAKFITSNRGKQLILLNGYKYTRNRLQAGKTRWLCSTHVSKGCKARLHTVNDVVVEVGHYHDHPPPINNLRNMKLIS